MLCYRLVTLKSRSNKTIGPLHDPVTWYNITHVGVQVAHQGQVQVDWYELHCFGSPTTQPAHQHVFLYHAIGLCKWPIHRLHSDSRLTQLKNGNDVFFLPLGKGLI